MSKMIRIVAQAALLAALAVAPTWAQDVNADWDKAVNFAAFKTYAWTQGTLPPGVNPLMVQRVNTGVEAELAAIGLVKVDKDPDVLVAVHGATKEDVSLQSWGYSPRFGGGSVNVNRVLIGMVIVDIIDARTKQLAFRVTATDTISDNPQKNEKKVQKAIEKMFDKYPTNVKK